MLAGFELPTAGELLIDGQPMSTVPPNARPTNMVFQNYAIFPHLNVRENIAYGLRKRKLGKAEMARTVEQALELIKMPGYGERRSDQLSGGQRQRVALARALVCQPKVLLLDEPLGALDKKLREEMQIELRQIQRTVGITFVFVTHDQEEALTLSDRVAVMSRGKVLQIDHATRLYEAPNCREVAEFIGTMNILPGTVSAISQRPRQRRGRRARHVRSARRGRTTAQGASVLVAIRPEKLQISWERPSLSVNTLSGKVGAVAYFGDRSHFYVNVEGCDKAAGGRAAERRAARRRRRSGRQAGLAELGRGRGGAAAGLGQPRLRRSMSDEARVAFRLAHAEQRLQAAGVHQVRETMRDGPGSHHLGSAAAPI